jgi:hypothetical protein
MAGEIFRPGPAIGVPADWSPDCGWGGCSRWRHVDGRPVSRLIRRIARQPKANALGPKAGGLFLQAFDDLVGLALIAEGEGTLAAGPAWIGVSGAITSRDRWALPCCRGSAHSAGRSARRPPGSFGSPPMMSVASGSWSVQTCSDPWCPEQHATRHSVMAVYSRRRAVRRHVSARDRSRSPLFPTAALG